MHTAMAPSCRLMAYMSTIASSMGLMARSQRTLCVHAETGSLRCCSALMSKPEPGVYPGSWLRSSSFLRLLACAAASGRVPPSPCRLPKKGNFSVQTPDAS